MLTKYYDSMLNNVNLWDPFRVFDDLYVPSQLRAKSHYSNSSYRVETTEDGLDLSVDLPGVKPSDLSVQTTGREVKISGKIRGDEFSYSYKLSRDYDTENSTAILENGVLVLHFRKQESAKSKTLEIKVK